MRKCMLNLTGLLLVLVFGSVEASADYLLVSHGSVVKRYDVTTGAFIDDFASGLNSAIGIALGPNGDFFVSSGNTNEVKRYDGTTGAFIGNFATGGGLNEPFGLTFGPDGDLYVVSNNNNSVKRYNGTTGAFISTFVSTGLSDPKGIAFGPDGNLYVGSRGTNQVQRYSGTTGAFLSTFASGGGLSGPTQFAFGPDGNLYVTSVQNNIVKRYNGTTGAFIDDFVSGNGLDQPYGLAFGGPNNNLFVSNGGTFVIKEFNGSTGAFIRDFPGSGGGFLIVVPAPPPNTDPDANAGPDQTVNCGPQATVTVTLDGTASSDPDGDTLEYVWTVPAGSPVTLANANNAVTAATIPATQSGDYPILLTVTDGKGGTNTDEVVIRIVVDSTPPDITCSTDRVSLWPPNHQIVDLTLFISASDGDVTAECTSSERDDANGDGEFTGDVNGGDGFSAPQPIALSYNVTLECYVGTLRLRAERDGSETGRTYSIVCTATDPYGNSSTARCAVLVPHDRRRN